MRNSVNWSALDKEIVFKPDTGLWSDPLAKPGWNVERPTDEQLHDFIAANNWQTVGTDLTATDMPVIMAHTGHSHAYSRGFSGEYLGHNFSCFEYEFAKTAGKEDIYYHFLILRVTLPKIFPYILISSHFRPWIDPTEVPTRLEGTRKLTLEGNFNDYFSLRVVPGSEGPALAFLTPDFMKELIDTDSINFEIGGDQLYIMEPIGQYTYIKKLKSIFQNLKVMEKQLTDVLGSWQTTTPPEEVAAMVAAVRTLRGSAAKLSGESFNIGDNDDREPEDDTETIHNVYEP